MNSINNLPNQIYLQIDPEVVAAFPDAKMACVLVAMPILSKKEQSKQVQKVLSDLKQAGVKQLVDLGITSESYETLTVCQVWRDVFASFGDIGDKRSTIENLLKRAAGETEKLRSGKKANMGDISNFVDAYNAVSVSTLTPMGANNITRYKKDPNGNAQLVLRFAREGETFTALGKDASEVALTSTSVVYADGTKDDLESRVTTGFWNWKDAAQYAVPNASLVINGKPACEYIILVADQPVQDPDASSKHISQRPGDAEQAILVATRVLQSLGATIGPMEVLTARRPFATLDVREMLADGKLEIGTSEQKESPSI